MVSTRKKAGRKLLVATLGVAAVSYLGSCASRERTGNLVAPPPPEEGAPSSDAGIEEPIPNDASVEDAASDTTGTGHTGHPGDIVANLMPPPEEPADGGPKK